MTLLLRPPGVYPAQDDTSLLIDEMVRGTTPAAATGFDASVAVRVRIPFGPVLRERLPLLREAGLLAPGQSDEGLVVIAARARG